MDENVTPMFLTHKDMKKLTKKSDKVVYRIAKDIRDEYGLRPYKLITTYHFCKFYNYPIDDIGKNLK